MLCPGFAESATAAFGSATRIKEETAMAIVLRSFITLLSNQLIRLKVGEPIGSGNSEIRPSGGFRGDSQEL
jgi:hypothetical protein